MPVLAVKAASIVVERVLHRGRGEHGEALVLRPSAGDGADPQQDDEGGEKSGKTMHRGAPCVFARAIARAQLRRWLDVECDRRKRRSADPEDLRSVRTSRRQAYSIVGAEAKAPRDCRYCFASGAASTCAAGGRQLRQRHRRPRLRRHFRRLRMDDRILEPVGEIAGACSLRCPAARGWLSHSLLPGGHLMRMWK